MMCIETGVRIITTFDTREKKGKKYYEIKIEGVDSEYEKLIRGYMFNANSVFTTQH
jgi:hypothetical protein